MNDIYQILISLRLILDSLAIWIKFYWLFDLALRFSITILRFYSALLSFIMSRYDNATFCNHSTFCNHQSRIQILYNFELSEHHVVIHFWRKTITFLFFVVRWIKILKTSFLYDFKATLWVLILINLCICIVFKERVINLTDYFCATSLCWSECK